MKIAKCKMQNANLAGGGAGTGEWKKVYLSKTGRAVIKMYKFTSLNRADNLIAV